ncbi:MAG TPA: DUF2721 domain-containing protein [Gemmatimonadales bacterium]|jgi:hypothetical protein|nr:DUF2721 domain-containing protein [Gemmatimonadales bacterium]
MQTEAGISSIASAIQLSIAPVFLLTGVGAILGVLTNRLARIVDRSRVLTERFHENSETMAHLEHDLQLLSERARLVNRAIGLCTFGALLVCLVIVALFVSAIADAHLGQVIALAFTAAMLALIGGLVHFLRETYLATRSLRTGRL